MGKVLDHLVELHRMNGHPSLQHVVVFVTDEAVGLDTSHPYSQHFCFWHRLLKHVDILRENVVMLDGNAEDLVAECARFEKSIDDFGGIDLMITTSGKQGELGANEPGSSLGAFTRIKTLSKSSIEDVADDFFFGEDDAVPKVALTIGMGTVMKARGVLLMFCGIRRSLALESCVEASTCHMWPVSLVQHHPNCTVLCDEDATMELRVKTVKYFKGLMRTKKDLKN